MSHGSYKCSKCGETASSKCVHNRSIFPQNENAAFLTHILKVQKEQWHDGTPKFIFTATLAGESELQALKTLLLFLEAPGVIESYSCDHDWVLLSETCGLGCCRRKEAV